VAIIGTLSVVGCCRVHVAQDAGVRMQASYNPRMARKPDQEHTHDHGVMVETSKPELARPPMYAVLLLNDDYTPMDFVVDVLVRFFAMNLEKATQIMLHVHTRGRGVCGVYTREVAESKVKQVNEYSRLNQHPLLCTMEKA
jgi:ATP-dependent Clp protease adaptor protein ClpS